jgi:ATPase subunit of ABC transporter with duplicated ATPase domains
VLDEPTNHLDVAAIEQLEAAVAAFGGTVLVVSHDASLRDGIRLTQVWSVDRGQVTVEVL